MPRDFLPSRESELVVWSANFDSLITATPVVFGLTAPQAAAYQLLNANYASAYQSASDPSTRTPSAIVAKNTAKEALVASARELARIIQASPSVTDVQKSDLGLTVRDVGPSPIPAPTVSPNIDVVSVSGQIVNLRLHDGSGTRRGKPAGVSGATLFSHVGATLPADSADWKFEGNTSRTGVAVTFPEDQAPGSKVWFTAFWFNPRKQSGPACTPVSTNIQGGGAVVAQAA